MTTIKCSCGQVVPICMNLSKQEKIQHCACGRAYVVDETTFCVCSTDRLSYLIDILIVLVCAVAAVFLVAPMDILVSIFPRVAFPNQAFVLASSSASFVLFPGVYVDSYLDCLYILAEWMVFFSLCYAEFMTIRFYFSTLSRAQRRAIAPLFVLHLLVFHALGNVHYGFYCAIGVIPRVNCFAMFDWKSFQMWFGGAVIVAVCAAVVGGIVFGLKWLFIARVQRLVVRDAKSLEIVASRAENVES